MTDFIAKLSISDFIARYEDGLQLKEEDENGYNCLHALVKHGRGDILRVLVERGCPVHIPSEKNDNRILPIELAANNYKLFNLLLRGVDPLPEYLTCRLPVLGTKYSRAIINSFIGDREEVIGALLSRGFDPNATSEAMGEYGMHPVLEAIRCMHVGALRRLVKAGGDLFFQRIDQSCHRKNYFVVRQFVDRYFNVDLLNVFIERGYVKRDIYDKYVMALSYLVLRPGAQRLSDFEVKRRTKLAREKLLS